MTVNRVRRNGSYAPLSAHYYKDDAIDEAGEAAELLYVRGLAFCADVLSDGFISERQLARFVGVGMFDAAERAERLVKVGLWERVDGGYTVRSWLEWNRSRAEITDAKAKDAARKRPGSGDPDSEPPEPDPPDEPPSESERSPNGIQAESESEGVPSPNGVPPRAGARARSTPLHSTTEPKTGEARAAARTRPTAANSSRRGSRIPDDFAVTTNMIEWARTNTPLVGRAETEQFIDYWRAETGAKAYKLDWRRAWQVWMRREQKSAERRGRHLQPVPTGGAFGQSQVADADREFARIRSEADGQAASRLIGRPLLLEPQPVDDSTDPRRWRRDRTVDWIDAHEREIRAQLTRDTA